MRFTAAFVVLLSIVSGCSYDKKDSGKLDIDDYGITPELAQAGIAAFEKAMELAGSEEIHSRVEKASIAAYRAAVGNLDSVFPYNSKDVEVTVDGKILNNTDVLENDSWLLKESDNSGVIYIKHSNGRSVKIKN